MSASDRSISPGPARNRQRGLTLVVVLVATLLISALILTLNARLVAELSLLGRIEEAHRLSVARGAVAERLKARWAAGALKLTEPVILTEAGRKWEASARDVEGLPDLYLSSPEVLSLTGLDGARLASARDALLLTLPAGLRLTGELQTMAALGIPAAERTRLGPLVTQRARTGAVNRDLMPAELLARPLLASQYDIAGGDLAELVIRALP